MFMLGGVAHNSQAQRDIVLEMDVFLEAQGEPVLEFFSRSVQQQNAEHLVVDQRLRSSAMRLSNSSRFKMEVSSCAISLSKSRVRVCRVVWV